MNYTKDKWDSADSYDYFMGRWSRLIALEFLKWLQLPPNLNWLDLGCGTGALSQMIYQHSRPSKLTCIDPSAEFLALAKDKLDSEGEFLVGSAENIPMGDKTVDVAVSGLALNFIPESGSALNEIKRILKPGGTVAAYVWDYSDRMDLLRYFWDAAKLIDPDSAALDEGLRFPICNKDNLKSTFQQADLSEVEVTTLDITTLFKDFNDYWDPFLGGQGPAPGYLASLNPGLQIELMNKIHNNLPFKPDGSIKLIARAFAAKGKSYVLI